MSVSAVSSSTNTTYAQLLANSSDSSSTGVTDSDQVDNPNSEMTKTDFLELLITRLKYQDPLSVEDTDFTGDLAQYSQLESSQNTNDAISTLSEKIDTMSENQVSQMLISNTSQAVSLVGKDVTIEVTDSDGNVTETVSGTVSTVRFSDGTPYLVVNGTEYSLSSVTEVNA